MVTPAPEVDVIIAVHSATRPVARAVSSVLDHTSASVRVTVVSHNIGSDVFMAQLEPWHGSASLRLLHLDDQIPSPAGPYNLGLSEATAPFVAFLGSDDEFEAHAIDAWLELQRDTNAAAIIPRIHHATRGNDAFPPVRPGRRTGLHPVKDRLAYRSAPLGLISCAAFGGLRFTENLSSGEDIAFATQIWFSGLPLAFDRTGPAYLGHDDATDRASFAPRALAEDFRFLAGVIDSEWFLRLGKRSRRAIAIKLLRTSVFDSVVARSELWPWTDSDFGAFTEAVKRILASAPGVERLLSVVDRNALEIILSRPSNLDEAMAQLGFRWNHTAPNAILPRNPFYALHRQGPLRTLRASLIMLHPVETRVPA